MKIGSFCDRHCAKMGTNMPMTWRILFADDSVSGEGEGGGGFSHPSSRVFPKQELISPMPAAVEATVHGYAGPRSVHFFFLDCVYMADF